MSEDKGQKADDQADDQKDEGDGEGDSSAGKKDDKVSYESYQKAINEKKAIQKRLQEFEQKAKADKEAELKQKEQYKTLYDEVLKENESLKAKTNELESNINNSRKLNAFLKNIEGQVPQQYWNLIDLDKVIVGEDGQIDEASVKRAAKQYEKDFPETIKKADGKGGKMPHDAARGGAGKLTHAEWEKLPYDEQRKRMKDVDLNS